jgi:hypothetical protein
LGGRYHGRSQVAIPVEQHDLLGDHLGLSLLYVKLGQLGHLWLHWGNELVIHLFLVIDRHILVKVWKSCKVIICSLLFDILVSLIQEIRLASHLLGQWSLFRLRIFLNVSHNPNHLDEFARLFLDLIHRRLLHHEI